MAHMRGLGPVLAVPLSSITSAPPPCGGVQHPLEELHRCGRALQEPLHVVHVAARAADVGRVVRPSGVFVACHYEVRSECLHLVERSSPRVATSARESRERQVHTVIDDVTGYG